MWSTIMLLMTGFAGGVIFIILAEIAVLVLVKGMEGDSGPDAESSAPPAVPAGPHNSPESIWRPYSASPGGAPHDLPTGPYPRHDVRFPYGERL
jgi:hypothetical protein